MRAWARGIAFAGGHASAMVVAETYEGSIVVRRWLGAWIDFIVLLLLFLLIPDYVLGNEMYRATLWLWVGLGIAYFPMMETLFGKTVGKFVTRTRVVNAQGRKPSLVQSSVRTLFRLLEVNPLLAGGIPAGIAVLMSRHRQRIGDMVAGTYVLRDRDVRQVVFPELPGTALQARPLPDSA